MNSVRHGSDIGHRLHEESIRLQQYLAAVPLPLEKSRSHPVLHATGALLIALVLVALALVLLPPGAGG